MKCPVCNEVMEFVEEDEVFRCECGYEEDMECVKINLQCG